MNSFGNIFTLTIFGESHGEAVGITIDGCTPGIPISVADFMHDLLRRKGGTQPGTTPRVEDDIPELITGVFNGFTTGAPLTILFKNKNANSKDYTTQRKIPRPGHVDFVASQKFNGFEDYRGSGHFSGRLTVCLVAAGVIAKKMLRKSLQGFQCDARVSMAAGTTDIESAIARAVEQQDSIGGVVECRVVGLPVGLGEPFFNSAESLLAHALFSIPAIKGVSFGSGFQAATMSGVEHNDPLINESGQTLTNNAGGIVGGITNGNELIIQVAVKPASSTPAPQNSLNIDTGEITPFQIKGRHDLAIFLRVPVVVEAVTCCVLNDLYLLQNSKL